MHALHLPPRHLWRVTLLAALLALAVMAILPAAAGRLGSGDGSRATSVSATAPVDSAPAPRAAPQTSRPPLAPVPDWLADPVRSPRLGQP